MELIVSLVLTTTIFYIVAKIIEMKFVHKEMRPMKELMRDSVVVAVATALASLSVMTLNKPMNGFIDAITEKTAIPAAANVFTGDPGF
jgi:hypothetical protein